MSSGSWLSDGTSDIGSKPNHMGDWEKFQLGWLNYEVAFAGRTSSHKIGPAESTTKQAQGLFVVLPRKSVVSYLGAPYAGSNYYYSSAGDNLNNFMYKSFDLAAGSTLTAKVKYDIELDWDYAYVVVSTDGGITWQSVLTNLSTSTDPYGQNKGFGITGKSSGWVDLTADLSAYNGLVLLGFRYWTDGAVANLGFMADDVTVSGYPADGAETYAGWTYKPTSGFHVTNGTEGRLYSHYYLAEFRQYRGYDTTLRTGPYNFGFLGVPMLGNWVEHFPYQDGLLINYWDTSQRNNNTRLHPGAGLILPIDAHPDLLLRPDGLIWRGRIQAYDSTFGLEKTDPICLHLFGVEQCYGSLPANPLFDDTKSYWVAPDPSISNYGRLSVIVPNTGTTIRVVNYSARDNFMQVTVAPKKQ